VRLAIVSQEYPGVSEYYGGIGTQYGGLAPGLAALGIETHVLTLAPEHGPAPAELEGVHVHALVRGRAWPWQPALWARAVGEALARCGPFDAILSPEYRGELWRYVRRQDHGPAITHLLTSTDQLLALRPGLTWRERNGPRTRLYRRMEREQAERSAAVLAPGAAVLDWARELWPGLNGRPAATLPLFIRVADVRRLAAEGSLPDGFPSRDGPRVMLASRLDGHKGAQTLVDAMHRVWRAHPDARLIFVGRDAPYGGGMMSDHLRERAGARADRLHVLGGQPPDRYFAAVAAADVVAIPSLWESFCLAAVEAMALGRPVIGTTGHGFSEYLEDGVNGLLVGRGETAGLAVAVERLLDDADLRERLGTAAARTAETLDVHAVAERYATTLARLAGCAPPLPVRS
jgi:glycosyltransferase involved in cell wall biosynthesis